LKTLEGRIKELEHENDNLKALNEDLTAAKKEKEEIGCILEDFKALHKGIRVFFSGPFGRCVSDIQQSRVYKMPGGSCQVTCGSIKVESPNFIGIWVEVEDRPITVTYELKATDPHGKKISSTKTRTHTFLLGHRSWGRTPDSLKEAKTVTIDLKVMGWEVEN
jgi:hypothetical protein